MPIAIEDENSGEYYGQRYLISCRESSSIGIPIVGTDFLAPARPFIWYNSFSSSVRLQPVSISTLVNLTGVIPVTFLTYAKISDGLVLSTFCSFLLSGVCIKQVCVLFNNLLFF